jgi:hypothetical protein
VRRGLTGISRRRREFNAAEPLPTTDHRLACGLLFLSFASLTTFNEMAFAVPLVLYDQKELLTAASLTVFFQAWKCRITVVLSLWRRESSEESWGRSHKIAGNRRFQRVVYRSLNARMPYRSGHFDGETAQSIGGRAIERSSGRARYFVQPYCAPSPGRNVKGVRFFS